MKTLGRIYGTEGTFLDRNPHFKGYNDRMDHIVKCPECGQGMAFTDILRVNHKWGCPLCNRYISHVTEIVRREEEE
jgi:uncharacterized paraquat-inducible protein A